MILEAAAAILTWTLPPGGAEPDGFRVYVCTPGDPGEFRVHREVVEARRLEVPPGTYRVTALYNGRPVTDAEGVESPSTVESALSDPIAAVVEPDQAPPRAKITLWSSPDLSREKARVEAIFYQPMNEPARFWWAEIKR